MSAATALATAASSSTANVTPELRRFLTTPTVVGAAVTAVSTTQQRLMPLVDSMLEERQRWTHFATLFENSETKKTLTTLSVGDHVKLLRLFRDKGGHFNADPADSSRESVLGPLVREFPWERVRLESNDVGILSDLLRSIKELSLYPVWLGKREAARLAIVMGRAVTAATDDISQGEQRFQGEHGGMIAGFMELLTACNVEQNLQTRLINRLGKNMSSINGVLNVSDWIAILAAAPSLPVETTSVSFQRQLFRNGFLPHAPQLPNRIVFRYLMHLFTTNGNYATSVGQSLLSLQDLRTCNRILFKLSGPRRKEPKRTKSSTFEKDMGRVMVAITKKRPQEQTDLFPFVVDFVYPVVSVSGSGEGGMVSNVSSEKCARGGVQCFVGL